MTHTIMEPIEKPTEFTEDQITRMSEMSSEFWRLATKDFEEIRTWGHKYPVLAISNVLTNAIGALWVTEIQKLRPVRIGS